MTTTIARAGMRGGGGVGMRRTIRPNRARGAIRMTKMPTTLNRGGRATVMMITKTALGRGGVGATAMMITMTMTIRDADALSASASWSFSSR